MTPPNPLPIDAHLPRALEALDEAGALVLTAEPGAGKTTRLPPALLDAREGAVWVLEPRRLAARLAAERVARERGQSLGDEVGYQVRFDRRVGPSTRLVFMTEGVLVRRLAEGPAALRGVSALVLDEFHERHLETDLALALAERARRSTRPDLRLVVVSATLDPEPIARHLGAPVLEVPGRIHPVRIEHARGRDERPLEDRVHEAVAALCADGLAGHVLVFLPGVGEIRRAESRLAALARREDLLCLPLHGRLDPASTRRALAPSERRKVLLATNVAESSLTIDGVEAVIDSGLARVATVSPRTGLKALELRPIPRSSAVQRAHRAGRQGPGRCLRLYTRADFERRPPTGLPELARAELSGPLLLARAAGAPTADALPWLDPPPAAAVAEAEALLRSLGAVGSAGQITDRGRDLLRYPVAPRLARVVQEGARRGIAEEAARAAALLSERSLRSVAGPAELCARSDVLELLDRLDEAERARFERHRLERAGIDPRAAREVLRVAERLARLAERTRGEDAPNPDEALLLALLAGHPDRVARRGRGDELVLARGGRAQLCRESVVRDADWLVALDALDPRRPRQAARVRLASAIEPEWLLELFPEEVEEVREVAWDATRERVEARWLLRYGQLVLEESPERGDVPEATALLREKLREAGAEAVCDTNALGDLRRRLAFARQLDPGFPDLPLEEVLDELCAGRRSFAEVRRADPLACARARLGAERLARLDRLAPEVVVLPGGRRCRVRYEERRPPWISSRLQDFFGLREGPRIGDGAVPLVLHLLAPNRQAVAVTTDLAGFWERTYPVEARRLSRRYPRHAWPEDPATARPPRPGRSR
ncbi:MAG: ATP-dependent helicase HrpB [Planctomycetota bacterium]|nr:MAG: ATP-dependent helicase HrpB [Planctomycetota bacterium]